MRNWSRATDMRTKTVLYLRLPNEGEDDNEELEQGDRHDDEVDGGGVDLLVDLARGVHKGQVVSVN